ncbi:MAG: LysE family transporter [Anaerolineae bacterium]|nr:LysE family transporter [Anaerolineae bacterium]
MGAFLFETVLVSLSGVMSPGPLSAVTVGKGSESPHAGALIALGHGAVELPLIGLVALGMGTLFKLPYVETAIALIGGGLLLWMGIGMLRDVKGARVSANGGHRYPFVAGVLLSAGNPFFLLWWATIGAGLVGHALEFGFGGLLALAVTHWLCDFGWSYFLSALSFRGGAFFGRRFQQAIFLLCGVFLLFFGGKYVIEGVAGLLMRG